MKKALVLALALTVACHLVAVEPTANSEAGRIWIPKSAGVYWWAGIIDHGFQMPLTNGYEADLLGETYGNQGQPLLLSSQGDVIWSEDPLRIKASEEGLLVQADGAGLGRGKSGGSLR